jgi:sterol desaturase/sphingolipid hydroxylase (fatty acid hydroxylase superfamily)
MANDLPPSDYVYGERSTENMPAKAFEPGAGRISGYLSAWLGALSLLGVLCSRYPSWLTTGQLREVYDVELLRVILRVSMWTAFGLGVFNFTRNKRKRMGAIGVLCTLAAFWLGGWQIPAGPVPPQALSLGVDWMILDLLGSALIFIFIEKLFPRYEDQIILRPDWQLDLVYFAINHLLIGVLLLVGNHFAPALFGWAVHPEVQTKVRSLPLFAQVVLLMFCADFVQYWIHRAYHEVPWLWKLHAVHHSTEYMDWLASSRNHTLQTLIDRSLAMVPLFLLGPDKAALDTYVVFAGFQAVFVHANVGLPLGWLSRFLVTPQFHHWHHSSDKPAIDTNYAVHLPLFDMIFGTFHLPPQHWPIQYGTVSKLPKTLWGQLAYPFVRTQK